MESKQYIDILGIEEASRGRSCEWHEVCGSILEEDTIVKLRKVQIAINGKEDTAVAAYWITDGVERCRVGFLSRAHAKKAESFHGKLAQVMSFLKESSNSHERKRAHQCKGIARAMMIGTSTSPPKKRAAYSMDQPAKKKAKP